MARPERSNSSNQKATNAPLQAWAVNHLRTFIGSLGFLSRNALSSFMTIAVIAIALALPAGMYVLVGNLNTVSDGWDNSARISLFLKSGVNTDQARQLADKLEKYSSIAEVKLITSDQALQEFTRSSGFGEALKALGSNPLPNVISLLPVINSQKPGQMQGLLNELKNLPQVELAQLDLQWVKRLYTMLEIANRAIWIIASLLGIAVLLVVGNTIRLDIQNRREEIEVTKLIGATNAFIRRPFLYTGFWYGLGGGILAWILTSLAIMMMDDGVSRLSSLYNSSFQLAGLGFSATLNMIFGSCLLGLGGSWLAVSRHLHEIEPS